MKTEWRVEYSMNDDYRVVEIETDEVKFLGSLADCEAWIRLTERGLM